jgi:hypothetical protein
MFLIGLVIVVIILTALTLRRRHRILAALMLRRRHRILAALMLRRHR